MQKNLRLQFQYISPSNNAYGQKLLPLKVPGFEPSYPSRFWAILSVTYTETYVVLCPFTMALHRSLYPYTRYKNSVFLVQPQYCCGEPFFSLKYSYSTLLSKTFAGRKFRGFAVFFTKSWN